MMGLNPMRVPLVLPSGDVRASRPLTIATLVLTLAIVPPAPQSVAAQTSGVTTGACASPEARLNEAGLVPIGGIEQWVTITGESCANPVLLFLHGGPGNAMSPYAATIFRGWERDFTLVQWDQRGAGRTFGRNPPGSPPLTVQRMADDGLALVEYLRTRLGKQKIVLVGGSWGSILGVHMIKARPDLFHAYVGFAQVVGSAQNQSATYARVRALAAAAADSSVSAALDQMGPPPWTSPRNPGIVRRATRAYEARTTDAAPAEWWIPAAGYDSPQMLADAEAGDDYSYLQFVGVEGNGMFAGVDLPALGAEYRVPVLLVQGTEDLVTAPEVTREFFDGINAPMKELVMVPRTGHDPNRHMIDAIRALLDRRVAPLLR